MRKHLPCFVFLSIILLNLFPTNTFGLEATNPLNTPTTVNQEEVSVTYVSTIEEYENAIRNPKLTVIEILENLDLTEMSSAHEIIIDGYNRIIDYRNIEITGYQEKPLFLNYKTNHSLNLRNKIGPSVNLLVSTLDEESFIKSGDFEPKLFTTSSYGNSSDSDDPLFETIHINGETLRVKEAKTRKNIPPINFYKETISGETNYYLELNNYNGDKIRINKLIPNSIFHIVLNGKNVISTNSEFGIYAENTTISLDAGQEPASLTINVNSKTETGIGITLDYNQPQNNSNLKINKDVELELNIANQNPSDNPFLTGILGRHSTIDISWARKATINIVPNFISKSIETTNNVTGITTELDGEVKLLRNNIIINNPNANYAIWTGHICFLDEDIDLSSNENITALNNEPEESRFIYKNSKNSGINNNHINNIYYNRTNYVERITPFESFKKFSLDRRINYLELILCQEMIDKPIGKNNLNDSLAEFYNCFSNKTPEMVELENLELFFDEELNQYFLIINLNSRHRYAFKNNTKAAYSYKDYFRIEDDVENLFLLNYNQIDKYIINSLDSLSLFYPLNVIDETPILLTRVITDESEPEKNEELKEERSQDSINNPEENYHEIPNTSADNIQSIYLLILIVSSFGLPILFNRRSDII